MEKTVILCKAWSHAGTEYPVGTCLKVDGVTADELVKSGAAELSEPEGTTDDAEKTVVTQGKAATETKSADDQPVTMAAVSKMLDETLAPLMKRVTPRPTAIRVDTRERIEDDPRAGYVKGDAGFGKFCNDVLLAGHPARQGPIANNLKHLEFNPAKMGIVGKAVGSDEYATVEDAIGGYMIPPEFRAEIFDKGIEPDFVRPYGAQQLTINSTSTLINAVSDTDRSGGTIYGGIQVYTQSERAQLTSARGKFEQIEPTPKMLTAIYFMTDNLLHHVPSLGAFLGRQFQDAVTWKEMDKFVNGQGAGEPLGVLNASATYSQAKETGQAAATIVTRNLIKMRSRMRPAEYANAMWIASNSCMEQLNTLTLDVGTGGAPVALVNIGNDGVERILGKPLVYTEFNAAVGTVGDIILCSWPAYVITETTYRNVASSIHLRFDYNETAFRVVKTIDGQPWWRSTLTLKNSWEVSPFITLAARA
jgi:HK97 family phage major capsid protein